MGGGKCRKRQQKLKKICDQTSVKQEMSRRKSWHQRGLCPLTEDFLCSSLVGTNVMWTIHISAGLSTEDTGQLWFPGAEQIGFISQGPSLSRLWSVRHDQFCSKCVCWSDMQFVIPLHFNQAWVNMQPFIIILITTTRQKPAVIYSVCMTIFVVNLV